MLETRAKIIKFELKTRQEQQGNCVGYGILETDQASYKKLKMDPIFKMGGTLLSCSPYYKQKSDLRGYLSDFNERKLTIFSDSKDLLDHKEALKYF